MAQPQSDLSADEGVFFMVAVGLAAAGAFLWYRPILRIRTRGRILWRLILGFLPILLLLFLCVVLSRWADPVYVVGHPEYQQMFVAGGAAWIWWTGLSMPLTGLSIRDDALERTNSAAAMAACGTVAGSFVIYCGANIGGGPTIWTTLAPAAVATAAYFALAFLVEAISRPSEAIAIDRDLSTAIRQLSWKIAAGVILGRAVAGDWWSWERTFSDLVQQGWPAVVVAACSAVLHIIFRPSPRRPRPPLLATAIIPGAILFAASMAYVVYLGKPEIGKHIVTYEEYERSL
jgi:hypothetical protein